MNRKKFNAIIDFAIDREKEAVEFYKDLKRLVFFEKSIELLDNLQEMEKVHIEVLESIRIKTMKNVLLPRMENLDVADNILKTSFTVNLSYHDILVLAMQREEESIRLYTKMAGQYRDEEIRRLFLRLATEEAGHKAQFEKLFDEDM